MQILVFLHNYSDLLHEFSRVKLSEVFKIGNTFASGTGMRSRWAIWASVSRDGVCSETSRASVSRRATGRADRRVGEASGEADRIASVLLFFSVAREL